MVVFQIEQYVERASIANKFEYGHARMGIGCRCRRCSCAGR